MQAKQEKRPEPSELPSTPDPQYITRVETGLKGQRYSYIYTKYSSPSLLTYLLLITSALQVLRHIRQMQCQRLSAPVWRAPANAGACVADALFAIFIPFFFADPGHHQGNALRRGSNAKSFGSLDHDIVCQYKGKPKPAVRKATEAQRCGRSG